MGVLLCLPGVANTEKRLVAGLAFGRPADCDFSLA